MSLLQTIALGLEYKEWVVNVMKEHPDLCLRDEFELVLIFLEHKGLLVEKRKTSRAEIVERNMKLNEGRRRRLNASR